MLSSGLSVIEEAGDAVSAQPSGSRVKKSRGGKSQYLIGTNRNARVMNCQYPGPCSRTCGLNRDAGEEDDKSGAAELFRINVHLFFSALDIHLKIAEGRYQTLNIIRLDVA